MKFLFIKVKSSKVLFILMISFYLAFVIVFFWWKPPYSLFQQITLLSLLLLSILFNIIGYIFYYKVIVVGEIEFIDDVVNIYNTENKIIKNFKLDKIEKLKLECFSFKGYAPQQTPSINFFPSKGNGNSIEFVYDNESFKYEIFLANEKETNKFKILNKFLKEKNIDVTLKMMQ